MRQSQKNHPEFQLEEARLGETLECIKTTIQASRQAHTDGGDDWANFNLEQQRTKRAGRLGAILDKPYFGHIDFREDGSDEVEEFYIGYLNLNNPIRVIDWRASLASVFYTRNRSQVSYDAPGGTIFGELFLKRHLEIEFSQLLKVSDELDRRSAQAGIELAEDQQRDVLIDPDEFLRLVLEGKKGRELRDVVATIQERQDELIRAKPQQILIIQGVAGSGKTTIALHRLAFLLYPQSNGAHLDPQKMLIIGANSVFLDFISQVLPRLGIAKIPQMTFTEWASRIMGRQAPHGVTDATLTEILDQAAPREQRVTIYSRSRFKGSLKIIPLLDRLVEFYHEQLTAPQQGLTFAPLGKGSLGLEYQVPASMIQQRLAETVHLPVNQRRNAVISAVVDYVVDLHNQEYPAQVEELIRRLETKTGSRQQLQKWAELIEPYDYRRIPSQKAIEQRQIPANEVSSLIELAERKRRRALDSLRGEIVHLVTEAIDRLWPPAQAAQAYLALLFDAKLLKKLSAGILDWKEVQILLQKGALTDYRFRVEDIAPLTYLHLAFEGTPRIQTKYDYIVVDEAQDLSPLQFWLLRQFSNTAAMTILGDLAQSIHSYRGVSRWQEVMDVFPDDEIQYEEVEQTYRSTYEIMSFANEILLGPVLKEKNYRLAKPFQRHGPDVIRSHAKDARTLFQSIHNQLRRYEDQGYESVAVICKSDVECEQVQRGLKSLGVHLPTVLDANQKLLPGTVILPAHITKGLEFEACIIANANTDNYTSTELDGRILYVSITRALHELAVFWTGQPSPHLATQ